ncbi:hypothetical protein WD019_11025 [Fictibacillus sp. Mic-4]|uniref:hypothetical protein n=1 Tax=Fictibacillus sp. Mic-4 TaxID=3132826 RepID=UPI003CEA0FEF
MNRLIGMASLFNRRNGRLLDPVMRRFGYRRNGRGGMLFSSLALIIGIATAFFGMQKGRNLAGITNLGQFQKK